MEVVDSRKKKSSIKSSPKIQAKTYGNGKQSGKIQTAKKSVAVVDNFSDSDVTELNGTNAEDSDVEGEQFNIVKFYED